MPYGLRRLRRAWSSGELRILALAIVIAVAASSAVGLFSGRVRAALEDQTGEAFGADAAIRSRDPLPAALMDRVATLELRTAEVVQFPSVALAGDSTALAGIKAVDQHYPLRGALRTSTEPFAPEQTGPTGPARGEVWVDLRLWQELDLARHRELRLGRSSFRVTRILNYEPDRSGGFSELAPRALINLAELAATGLAGEGSRVQYTLMLAGPADAITELKGLPLPANARLITPGDGRPEVRGALTRAQQFLDIAVLSALLLAAVAIAATAQQYGMRLRDEAALLKALGASSGFLARTALLQLLMIACVAGVIGIALGWGGQALIALLLADLMRTALPPASLEPIWASLGLALLVLIGFAAPPWLAARHTPPIRVFQRAADPRRSRFVYAIPAAAVAALLWLQTGDTKLALVVLGGTAGSALVLGLLAWLLVRGLAPLRQGGGTALRFGLGNIARRGAGSVAQIVALGLALLALLLVVVVREDLLESWRGRLPPQTPNQFLINVQTDQLDALRGFFAERGIADLPLWPMTRARLTALNGETVTADSFDDPETRRWINREFNLSWTDKFGDDNELIEGRWWDAGTRGKPWVSVDEYAVERLNLKLGDRMKLQIADREVELSVHSVRKVHWDSFRPNFFLVAPPGVLEDGPTQWLTSFYLPAERRELLRDLIIAFPNITAIDLDAALTQVREIIERIVRAVSFIFAFTLAAGLAVLLAAIEGTRAERVRETGLLRALGASSRTISLGLLAEYAALGLVAGLVAAGTAQAVGWGLARFVFEMSYGFSPRLWVLGALGGTGLVTVLGWLALRRTLFTSPRSVLAAGI